jgi:hypothetical protein
MIKGVKLPVGKARQQFDSFCAAYGRKHHPMAVCYTLAELQDFFADVKGMFERNGIPQNQQGIALTMGIHQDPTRTHANNRITLMLVATQWVDGAPHEGRVVAINNPIDMGGWTSASLPTPPPIDDLAFDAGSLWP